MGKRKGCNYTRAYDILNYVLLAVIVLIVLMPILVILNVSLKTNEEYLYSGLFDLPGSILNFSNYLVVIQKGKLIPALGNTGLITVVAVLGSIVMGTMVSYVLERFNFKAKKLLLLIFLVPTVIPGVTTQVATFTVIKNLHLYNTIFAGIILFVSTDIVQIYIFLQFISKIPVSIDESASIDGASYIRIFRSILLPQLKPAIATVAILKIVSIYNDMLIPYLYMPKSSLRTVTTALLSFSYDKNSQWNIMSAGIIAVMLPTIVLYLLFQKYILAGIGEGAVKG